jgi:PAS domain S-box-containing protein
MTSPCLLASETYRQVLENLPIGVYLVDRQRRIALWNEGCERITGYLRHEVIGRCCADELLMHCDEQNEILCGTACPLLETMHDGRPREADLFLRHKEGQLIPVHVQAIPVRDEHGSIVGACECFDEREVLFMANHQCHLVSPPHLAGENSCLSESDILQRLHSELEELRFSHIPFGVLCMAIDRLDSVRTADGVNAVKRVLYTTSETLKKSIGHGNWFASRPNLEFVAILKSCTTANLVESSNWLKRLVSLDAVPWWGGQLKVTLSVGGTVAREGETAEALIHRAEEALRQSIEAGVSKARVV